MLSHEDMLAALDDWNYWDRPIPAELTGHPRTLTERVQSLATGREAVAVVGIRRCGKTTILHQLMAGLIAGGVEPRRLLYVNLEDQRFYPERGPELLDRIVAAYREGVNPTEPAWLFLDEVQAVTGWERWARTRLDLSTDRQLYVSGSSSSLLSSELSALLTGRCLVFTAHPFSFREYLEFRAIEVEAGGTVAEVLRRNRKEATLCQHHLRLYLEQGGFPLAVASPEPMRRRLLLQQYFDDILARDIVFRHEVRNTSLLRDLALTLMNNIGNLVSFSRLARALGTSPSAIQTMLGHLEESLLLHSVRFFSHSVQESVSVQKPRKIYAEDPGMRNAVAAGASPDLGRLAENAAWGHLAALGTSPRYWAERNEVDFVADPLHPTPINICFADEIPEREFKALQAFAHRFGRNHAILLSRSTQGTRKLDSLRIEQIPLWAFLLADGFQTT